MKDKEGHRCEVITRNTVQVKLTKPKYNITL